MSYFDEKELLEKRGQVIDQQESLLQQASSEGRDLTPEEQKQFDGYENDYSRISKNIENVRALRKKQEQEDEKYGSIAERASKPGNKVTEDEIKEKEERQSNVFWKAVRFGERNLNGEEREVLAEMRAQSVGTDADGGYTVPEDFSNQLEDALKSYGGVREAADVITTSTGAALPWPTVNDTSNKGAILAENTQVSEQDVTFGVKTLDAYKYSSKLIKVSVELLQDSAFNLENFLRDKLAERIGRITNEHFTTGTGTNQPNGIVTASTAGKTTASTTAFTFAEVLDLKHSVDPSYRGRPGTRFMLSDATLAEIKKLSVGSSDARPLWQPSYVVGEPDRIDGDRYIINQDMADAGTLSNKFMLYGDMSKYIIRDVKGFVLLVLRERYADFHQVGFLGFSRHDGELIDAGTNPVKHMAHAAA